MDWKVWPWTGRRSRSRKSVRSSGGSDFNYLGLQAEPTMTYASGPRSSGAVVACVQRITSRACDIPFVSDDPEAQVVLDNPSWLKSVDPRMMWERLYNCILYDGDAAIVRTLSNKLRVGRVSGHAIITEARPAPTMQQAGGMETPTTLVRRRVETQAIGDESSETIEVSDADVCRLRWSEDIGRPWSVVRTDAMAYDELADDLYQEGKFARRITTEVMFNDSFNDKAAAEEKLEEMDRLLKSNRKFITAALHKGMNYMPRPPVPSPDHGGRISTALANVARVYGVPLQLLQAGVWRMSIDQADAHLLRDAVLPLVDKVAVGLTKILKAEVKADLRKVGLPSRAGMPGQVQTLGQSGVLTINEIREVIDYKPIEGGDVLPQTAGAAERDNSEMGGAGADEGDDDDDE